MIPKMPTSEQIADCFADVKEINQVMNRLAWEYAKEQDIVYTRFVIEHVSHITQNFKVSYYNDFVDTISNTPFAHTVISLSLVSNYFCERDLKEVLVQEQTASEKPKKAGRKPLLVAKTPPNQLPLPPDTKIDILQSTKKYKIKKNYQDFDFSNVDLDHIRKALGG